MSTSSIDNEDLDNVALVRMEDVQPSRDRSINSRASKTDDEVYETCIVDGIEYENECIVNDDGDSNIGSMVSLQSEEVYDEDSSSQELIIPEALEEVSTRDCKEVLKENEDNTVAYKDSIVVTKSKFKELEERATGIETVVNSRREYKVNPKEYILHAPERPVSQTHIEIEVPPKVKRIDQLVLTRATESWPTLEILPGGVIKHTHKHETDSYLYPDKVQESAANTGQMMYACAKCSQTFKYLFCLVKHVKWHEGQSKTLKDKLGKLKSSSSNKYICLHMGKKKIVDSERNKGKSSKRLKS